MAVDQVEVRAKRDLPALFFSASENEMARPSLAMDRTFLCHLRHRCCD
jgi:hypothetical protein